VSKKVGRLKQYRGFLTIDKIAEGITAATSNAVRLAADAQLLFDDGALVFALFALTTLKLR